MTLIALVGCSTMPTGDDFTLWPQKEEVAGRYRFHPFGWDDLVLRPDGRFIEEHSTDTLESWTVSGVWRSDRSGLIHLEYEGSERSESFRFIRLNAAFGLVLDSRLEQWLRLPDRKAENLPFGKKTEAAEQVTTENAGR
jgi:hypothetical protein